MSSSNWVFASSDQKAVFLWRHIVLKSIVFYGCPNPLYVEIQMWHVLCIHEIGILASTNQKRVYWWRHRVLKMYSSKSMGAKTPYMFKYKCYMYYVFISSLKLVSSNQKTVFWWRHTVLKICPSYTTGPQTSWLQATLTFSSVLNEYLFLAHFEFILTHCGALLTFCLARARETISLTSIHG